MPGTNAGTGQPLTLRCAMCKKSDAWMMRSGGTNLEATGRTKPAPYRAIRQTTRKIEYRCLDCGHVGWTQHIDAERLAGRLKPYDRTRWRIVKRAAVRSPDHWRVQRLDGYTDGRPSWRLATPRHFWSRQSAEAFILDAAQTPVQGSR